MATTITLTASDFHGAGTGHFTLTLSGEVAGSQMVTVDDMLGEPLTMDEWITWAKVTGRIAKRTRTLGQLKTALQAGLVISI